MFTETLSKSIRYARSHTRRPLPVERKIAANQILYKYKLGKNNYQELNRNGYVTRFI